MTSSAREFLVAIVSCLVALCGSSARAEVLASLGTSVMFESAASGRSFDQRQPWAIRGGYRFEKLDAYAEYSRLQVASGTSYVGVTRKQEQILFWGRHLVKKFRLSPYAAIGAGVSMETVDTRFGTDERSDTGQAQGLIAFAAGAIAPVADWLELSLEARAESAQATAPQVVFGLSLFAAAKF